MIAVLRSIRSGAAALVSSIDAAIVIVQSTVQHPVQSPSNGLETTVLDGPKDDLDGPLDVSSSASSLLNSDLEAEENCNVADEDDDPSNRRSNHVNGRSNGLDLDRRSGLRIRGGLKAEMAGIWDGVGGVSTSGQNRARIAACEPLLRRIAAEQGREPADVFRDAVRRFKGHVAETGKRMGLAVLLSQLEAWCLPDAAPKKPASEDERAARVRDLRAQLQTAEMGETYGDTDAERVASARRAGELRAEIERLTTRAA